MRAVNVTDPVEFHPNRPHAAGKPDIQQPNQSRLADSSPGALLSALQALVLVARLHQVAAEPHQLLHQLGHTPSDPYTPDALLLAAQKLGLRAKRSKVPLQRMAQTPLPALALMRDGNVAVLARTDGHRVLLQRFSADAEPRPMIESAAEFSKSWTGELVLITSRASLAGALAHFDFSWFIPSLVKHRKLLAEVMVVSLFLQLFALVSPLFFQVVMDKVLVHRGSAH